MVSTDSHDVDCAVRQAIYDHFIRQPMPPTTGDIADNLGLSHSDVTASYERLAANHVVVLDPETRALWMAIPFSAVPTDVYVQCGERQWWANCAWDALGIAALLAAPSLITATCPDCQTPIMLEMPAALTDAAQPVLHFAVSMAHWWDDIGST